MNTTFNKIIFLGVCLFLGMWFSVFILYQKDRAVILRFGKILRIQEKPGLKFKIPFIENVMFVSKRLQGYTMPPLEVNDVAQKKILVNLYVRYVINNPELYLKNIGSGGSFGFNASTINRSMLDNRLGKYVSSAIRNIIGSYSISDLLSEKREKIMQEITNNVMERALEVGLQIKDVRIINFNLPNENLQNVFRRMESDRDREAKKLRADGQKKATEIIANSNKEKLVILAKANRDAKKTHGEASLEMAKIFAQFKNDSDNFLYLRSLDAYKKSFSKNTTHVINKEQLHLIQK